MTYKRGDLALTSDGRIFIVARQTAASLIGVSWYGGRSIPTTEDDEKALALGDSRIPIKDAIPYTPERLAEWRAFIARAEAARIVEHVIYREQAAWFRAIQEGKVG